MMRVLCAVGLYNMNRSIIVAHRKFHPIHAVARLDLIKQTCLKMRKQGSTIKVGSDRFKKWAALWLVGIHRPKICDLPPVANPNQLKRKDRSPKSDHDERKQGGHTENEEQNSSQQAADKYPISHSRRLSLPCMLRQQSVVPVV